MRDSISRPATLSSRSCFECRDLERRAPRSISSHSPREPREALALELGEAAFEAHLLHRRLRRLGDHRAQILLQVGVRAHARPDLAHQRMQELAAVARIEARRRLFHLLGAEAPARKGAERACGLVGEHARAAALLAGRERAARASPRTDSSLRGSENRSR